MTTRRTETVAFDKVYVDECCNCQNIFTDISKFVFSEKEKNFFHTKQTEALRQKPNQLES